MTVVSARTLADGNISGDDAFKDSLGALEETDKRRPTRMVDRCGVLSSRGSKVFAGKAFFFFLLFFLSNEKKIHTEVFSRCEIRVSAYDAAPAFGCV